MGIPLRNGGGGSFSVSITPLVKTCAEEAGIYDLDLPDGTRVVALAHAFWPSHDRPLVAAVQKYLREKRPELVILLGGMLHEEAFKQIVDGQDEVKQILHTSTIAEIAKVREEHEGMEERFLALAKMGGEFIASFAEASGGKVIYIPSVTGIMPNEIDIMRFVLTQKERADKWAEKHPDEAVVGQDIPREFAEFLGLSDNPNVTVLPFGSALRINGDTRFHVGDFRRRHPGSAAIVDSEQFGENVVRSFDGKVASAWWTTPIHSLGESHRRWWQAHEVGNLFDLKAQLGYLRNYDRRAKGIWTGTVMGGTLFSASSMILHGVDGRRSLFVEDEVYEEDEASPRARIVKLDLGVKPNAAKAAPKAAETTKKPRTPRKRTGGSNRGTKR